MKKLIFPILTVVIVTAAACIYPAKNTTPYKWRAVKPPVADVVPHVRNLHGNAVAYQYGLWSWRRIRQV